MTGPTAEAVAARVRGLRANALAAVVMLLVQYAAGSRFVGHPTGAGSFAMAIATAAAVLSYALVIFVVTPSPDPPPR